MAIDWPAIVHEYGPLVWKTAFSLLLNEADVSDCFQETFVSALEFSRRQKVINWPGLLQRIAASRALDQLRRRIREQQRHMVDLGTAIPSPDAGPVQNAEAAELSDRLRIALTQLPPSQGQAFCLRHLNGLEYEEIADEMKISVDAAGALLHRARTRLGELLLGAATVDLKRR
jgi:RNA polymerase sigma-70 factor, ECF subfamily